MQTAREGPAPSPFWYLGLRSALAHERGSKRGGRWSNLRRLQQEAHADLQLLRGKLGHRVECKRVALRVQAAIESAIHDRGVDVAKVDIPIRELDLHVVGYVIGHACMQSPGHRPL